MLRTGLLLLASLPAFVYGQMGGGGDCRSDKCGAGTRPVPVERIRPWSNGCSVPPFIQMPDYTFTKCCDLHDTCYMTCGVSKAKCEKAFDKCLKTHCKSAYAGDSECVSTADTFVMGVNMFGCNGYLGSQDEGCECVADGAATSRFAAYIDDFYRTYNATKIEHQEGRAEVSRLLEQFKGREGELVYKLYQKYPQVVEIISRNGQDQRTGQTFMGGDGGKSGGEL